MRRRVPIAWNGGSPERALELARERVDVMISQGATLCAACDGHGGTRWALCDQCRGAGCFVPPEGLKLGVNHGNCKD